MARSIGKVKIRKLQAMVAEEYAKGQKSYKSIYDVTMAVKARVPEDWEGICENAWSEIDRVIDDAVSALAYRR